MKGPTNALVPTEDTVRTSGPQTIAGVKTLTDVLIIQTSDSITDGSYHYPYIIQIKDRNGVVLGGLRLWMKGDGSLSIYGTARNQDGTYTDNTIVMGN